MICVNKECYIYHHLGMGDHLICNGLVREICKRYGKTFILCKGHNVASVEFMFRDLKNVAIYPVDNDAEASGVIVSVPEGSDAIKIGYMGKDWLSNTDAWDESFYRQAGLDFNARWDSFYFKRDEKREKLFYDKCIKKDEPYIFIHDDKHRGFIIDDNKIESNNKRLIRPERDKKAGTYNIFDYCKILERADEIHSIDSSFDKLVDCMNSTTKNIYFHDYARKVNRSSCGYHTYRRKWIII